MKIGDYSTDERVLVVAEIGNNHEGQINVAENLVRKAAECAVDAVKFQTFRTEFYVSKNDPERFARLKSFELSQEEFRRLSALAHSLGLLFMSTPFDLSSAVFLDEIVDCFKISSGDNNFYPLIKAVVQTGKPLIVSGGLSDLLQLRTTVAFIQQGWASHGVDGQLAVLHCVSSYPVPPEQACLHSIPVLVEQLNCTVGYSDHTIGGDAVVLAVAAGARIIEKHFTLSRSFSDFRDHQLSSDPVEMKDLVQRIRQAERFLGRKEKVVQACESAGVQSMRRSIAAGRDLEKGHILAYSDLTWTRPGSGLSPGQEDLLVGQILRRSMKFGEHLNLSDVEQAPL